MAKSKVTYYAVSPISAVEPLVGRPELRVWLPDGEGWAAVTSAQQVAASDASFAVVAIAGSSFTPSGTNQVSAFYVGLVDTTMDPWPDPPHFAEERNDVAAIG